ncbi:MAG TPA: CapA family protein [Armatimonadota bacterium]|jgi:poly-gamma-glutamate synthesis protein (capsule biosynthesis protein)
MRGLLLVLFFGLAAAGWAGEPSVLLAAVGDVMIARTVPGRMAAHGAPWLWAGIAPELRRADLRFCNLECAVSSGGRAFPKRYSFRADPAQARDVLAAGGISVAALANNHTYDFGRSALLDTLAAMHSLGIADPGAGIGRAGALAPRIVTCNGLRIAFVAYTWWTPEGYLPLDDAPALATLDEQTLATELHAAKAGVDLLIVSFHWGVEYAASPTPEQQRVAHLAIDAGADLILGHHPHVRQPVEIYHDRPILYSLGNCIFDRSGNQHSNGRLALVRLAKDRVTVEEAIPLRIEEARPVVEKRNLTPSVPLP